MKRMWSKNEILRMNDAQIRTLIESGTLDNAKPIYFHPLTLYTAQTGITIGTSTCDIFASATILNNGQSSLAGSLGDLYSYISGKFNRLNVSMILYDRTRNLSIHVVQLYFTDNNHIYVIAYDSAGTRIDESSNSIDLYSVRESILIIDGVNKIN